MTGDKHPSFSGWLRAAGCAATLAALSALSGCYATTSAYVEADAPLEVETYPQAYYQGRVVYLVGDRWYARRSGGWYYYRSEPSYLYRYRVQWYERHPVESREHREYRRAAPPVYRRERRRDDDEYRRAAPPSRRHAPAAQRD